MKFNMKKIFKNTLFAILSSLLFVQCKKDDTAVVPLADFIDVKLAADADLSVFKAAIAQAKLESFTKGPGPFTILAPSNAALSSVGLTTVTLPTIDSLTLTAFVLNHFQNLNRTSFEFPDGPNAPMASMAGFSNFASRNKAINKIYINGATVSETDITCGNGVIHKIDKALVQPVLTLRQLLKQNPNYTIMDSAISKTGLAATYAPTAASTIFAVDNATMIAAGYPSLAYIGTLTPVQVTTLTNILRYHIASTRNFSVAMKSGVLKTVQGSNLLLNVTGTSVTVKGTTNAAPFNLVDKDVMASNGVIHQVAGILMP
jgi:uncharacterized surface protein with fasciclin (FAS1) repeats